MSNFQEEIEKLNEAQRKAVEHIDGPLIVIAGPGTGKTQLLSLRAANILKNRDVRPDNILCLTYTDAGATAMTKRLIELIGRDGYGIEVATFHGFASSCRSRYPEYFEGGSKTSVVSTLYANEILDGLLKKLPFDDPLSASFQGVACHIGAVSQFISNMKRQGLTPDDYRAMMQQNIHAADYLESCTGFMGLLCAALPGKKEEKRAFVEQFREEALFACAHAPNDLLSNVLGAPGIYVPYIQWLREFVESTELMVGGSTAGFQTIRYAVRAKGENALIIRAASEKGLVAADVYEAYQTRLHEEGLRDFDDIIMDFVAAVRQNVELRNLLQERYRYIQVDEFQDTNGAQMRIVELLCDGRENPNVMAVGDDDQAIMRFQGASIACIGQFKERFSPCSVVLKTNYRSTPEVVKLGQTVAAQIERRLPESVTDKDIQAFRESGEQVTYTETVFKAPELQYLALASDIRRRIDEGFVRQVKKPDEAIAVIANKHKHLRALIPFLNAQNIPFTYVQTSDVFSMESMQTTLALLRLTVANASGNRALANSYLPQVIASPEFAGDSESSIRFALYAKREHHGDWMSALAATEDARLAEMYADITEWSAASAAAPVRELVFRITARIRRYYACQAVKDPYIFAEYNAGLRALLGFAEDELGTASAMGRTMRLADVIERIDRAERFGVGIDASISLGTTGAVNLKTAHGSKGLEYNLVYLLDAEQNVWHDKRGGRGTLYTPNLLIGDTKDEDDVRRLLFVAVTRAKDYLEIYRSEGSAICELSDSIDSIDIESSPGDLATAIETSWRDSYALDTPELQALLAPHLPPHSLSASALNLFVRYSEEEELGSMRFPQERVMGLPEPPQIILEYGTAVHAFLEEYVNTAPKVGNGDVEDMAARYRKQIECMDFSKEDTALYARRFDRVVEKTIPWVVDHVEGLRLETEVKLMAQTDAGVPLFGYCDLLLVDDDAKVVRVVDYKTGFNYPKGEPDRSYQRQLQFYRLLVENSPEYAGYRVASCENWYVEPAKDTGELHDPMASSVSDDDIAYLSRLINAAWHRIERGLFDTSAFEESEEKAAALEAYEKQGGRKSKAARQKALQIAYECWLIGQDEEICCQNGQERVC